MTRAELKARAKASLTGNWGLAIAALVVAELILLVVDTLTGGGAIWGLKQQIMDVTKVYQDGNIQYTINVGSNPGGGGLGTILLGGPVYVGLYGIFLGLLRGRKPEFVELFNGFKNFVNTFVAGLLVNLFTALWSLLFIIPGIVKSISYSQTFYILNDQPELSGNEARKASMRMMEGHKWEYFVLQLSFIPWYLLCVFVIPILYVGPYVTATMAAYYQNLRGEMAQYEEPQQPRYNLGDPERFTD